MTRTHHEEERLVVRVKGIKSTNGHLSEGWLLGSVSVKLVIEVRSSKQTERREVRPVVPSCNP